MPSDANRDEKIEFEDRLPSRKDFHRTSAIVVGLFIDRDDAAKAISDLREAGFTDDDIGVAMQDKVDLQVPTDEGAPAEGAAKGALSGGLVGGAIGLLGSLLIPGLGPIIVGGVLGSTLAGAGIGAAAGGLIGALVGMGVSREEAEHFDRGFREGGVLVTVGANDRAMEARSILRDRGGDLGPSFRAGMDHDVIGGSAERATSAPGGETWKDGTEDPDLGLDQDGSGSYSGRERRAERNVSYAGPERRMNGW